MSIQYTCNISKYHEVYANLSETSDLFYQSLIKRVDVKEYSRKLVAKAQRLEAWANNQLVGLLAYYKNEDENILYISNVSVLKECQGYGIASHLIEELKNRKEEKYSKIKLMVFSKDKIAINFYQKNGFYLDKKVGEQNEMYFRFDKIVPVVSVCCVTYNHEQYIRQCLDGFLMQKTTFPIEILIHDDASTDGTADIIREYEIKYPEIIKPIYQVENQYSKGVSISATYNWPRAQGKYIALCEGDDYWTDPLKLQKQVDFLEQHEDVGLCYTDCDCLFEEEGVIRESIFKNNIAPFHRSTDFEDHLLTKGYIAPLTWVYRRTFVDLFDMYKGVTDGTFFMALYFFKNSKVEYLPIVTATYRSHEGSASRPKTELQFYKQWSGVSKTQLFFVKQYNLPNNITILIILEIIDELLLLALQYKDEDFIKQILDISFSINTKLGTHVHKCLLINRQLLGIRSSKAYRLGKILLKPISWLRRLKS